MKKIAVFASGNGSNFQAIIDAVNKGMLKAEIALLVCDKAGAKAIDRARANNIAVFQFNPRDYASKQAFETEILEILNELEIHLIALAGYMRLIGETLLDSYEGRIVNIHPSLLPSFPGKNAIEQAFQAKVKVTGVTIHYVDAGMDTGPIIAQEPIYIETGDTLEMVTQKIQTVEHKLYPQVLGKLINEKSEV